MTVKSACQTLLVLLTVFMAGFSAQAQLSDEAKAYFDDQGLSAASYDGELQAKIAAAFNKFLTEPTASDSDKAVIQFYLARILPEDELEQKNALLNAALEFKALDDQLRLDIIDYQQLINGEVDGFVDAGPIGLGRLPIMRVRPNIPEEATKSGHCKVKLDVSEEGYTFNIRILSCSEELFSEESKRNAAKLRFRPQIIDGRPVAMQDVETSIRFRVLDKEGALIPE